jgi:hypothetical protein
MRKLVGMVLVLGAVAVTAFAGPEVPEIDPASGLGALAAIGGAMLIVRGRRKA